MYVVSNRTKEIIYDEYCLHGTIRYIATVLNSYILDDLKRNEEVVLVPVLFGAITLFYEIYSNLLSYNHELSKVLNIELVRISSYEDSKTPVKEPVIFYFKDPQIVFKNKSVYIIDDLVDTGKTLLALKNDLEKYCRKIRTCVVINKKDCHIEQFDPDIAGLTYCGKDFLDFIH